MFRLMSAFLLALGLVCSSVVAVTAQDVVATPAGEGTDVAAVAATVLGADPNALLTGLETPLADEDLPPGFVNPPTGEQPANADIVAAFTLPEVGLQETIGTVTHPFNTDPEAIDGLISAGIVNYVVAETEITAERFETFELGVASSVSASLRPGMAGDVERIDVGGTEALLISIALQGSGTIGLVLSVAVPVGNTIVIATVVVIDSGGLDSVTVLENSILLTLSAVEHLGEVAESVS